MKKSKKKLAVAALLAGSVVVSATSCHRSNPTVYGPPEEFQTQKEEENGSGGTNSEAGITGAAGEANSAAGHRQNTAFFLPIFCHVFASFLPYIFQQTSAVKNGRGSIHRLQIGQYQN